MKEASKPKFVIVGAGLVGCLMATYLAQFGCKVIIFEYRDDIRKTTTARGKSINLALSNRGLRALHEAGISRENVAHMLAPMKGRMIHEKNAKCHSLPYDVKYNKNIYSIGRNDLNKMLITEAEKNSQIYFKHKVFKINFQERIISAIRIADGIEIKEGFDYLIGCDGAFSIVRMHMLRTPMFNYKQTYIDHGYMELSISAKNAEEFKMASNYLHIWPRVTFMMIALPNGNGSWTVTLFMPFEEFNKIQDENTLLKFFQTHFADALQLIGEKNLINIFFSSKPQPLITVTCEKYNVGSRSLIIGDAAHVVVPFYGQGMNAGFEDCRILFEIMKNSHFEGAFEEFSNKRSVDGRAVSDLSMYNYLEMRNLVTNRAFLLKKKLDNFLYKVMPSLWLPLYVCVTFTDIPYSRCLQIQNLQNKVMVIAFLVVFTTLIWKCYNLM